MTEVITYVHPHYGPGRRLEGTCPECGTGPGEIDDRNPTIWWCAHCGTGTSTHAAKATP